MPQTLENTLCTAISQQAWYTFEKLCEVIFDARTGDCYPNYQYMPPMPAEHWDSARMDYAPSGLHGEWQLLHEQWYCSHEVDRLVGFINFVFIPGYEEYDTARPPEYDANSFDYPLQQRGKQVQQLAIYTDVHGDYWYVSDFSQGQAHKITDRSIFGNPETSQKTLAGLHVLPVLKVLDDPAILPDNPQLTALEKAQRVLAFWLARGWQPVFKDPVHTALFRLYHARTQYP